METQMSDGILTEDRLLEISIGEPRRVKCHVMFEEGKLMADEILYLRAELARLSKPEPRNLEDIS